MKGFQTSGNGTAWGYNSVSPVNCLAQMGSYDRISDTQEAALSGDMTARGKNKKDAAMRLKQLFLVKV